MTQIKEATAYHKYLMQENDGDIQRIANQICMDIMDSNNPQAFELMDATGDKAFCDETLRKAAQIVINLCAPVPVEGKEGRRLPVFGTSHNLTTDELIEKIRVTKVEIECLTESLPSLENELFYRNNPECRPKH